MSASTELGELRAQVIKPHWEYLRQSFELERCLEHRCTDSLAKRFDDDWTELDQSLSRLDPASREAILAVLNYEISVLLLRCRIEAAHLMPLKQRLASRE